MQEENNFLERNTKYFTEDERKKLTRKEFNKLKRIIKNYDDSHIKLITPVMQMLAHLSVVHEELKCIIERDGYFEEYLNGRNQSGTKKTVASDLMIQTQKNYSMFYKQYKEFVEMYKPKDDTLIGENSI